MTSVPGVWECFNLNTCDTYRPNDILVINVTMTTTTPWKNCSHFQACMMFHVRLLNRSRHGHGGGNVAAEAIRLSYVSTRMVLETGVINDADVHRVSAAFDVRRWSCDGERAKPVLNCCRVHYGCTGCRHNSQFRPDSLRADVNMCPGEVQ